jgi:helicase
MTMDEVIAKLLELKGWKELNITQTRAVEEGLLKSEDNFVVIAPTASGKTGVAQLAMLQALNSGERVVYLVPMTPLISEKEKDFEDLTAKIAGAKSSPAEWNGSDVVITTFEAFYKTALVSRYRAEGFGLAIVDEFHVLYDPTRGFNLEKVMTILKELGTRVICLSATFEDKSEIGEWLGAKVVVAPEEARKVEIKHAIIDLSNISQTVQNKELCKKLLEIAKGPYLVFCTTKESTKSRAQIMCSLLGKNVFKEEDLDLAFAKVLSRDKLTGLEEELRICLLKGVGFHHSGLDKRLKNFVEKLFVERRIHYLFATTGLAYGVNLPAKSVIVADTSFYDPSAPSKRRDIPIYMYIQMAGRAGRPDFEKEGYAFIVKKKKKDNVEKYLDGKIETAISHVGRDDYFRKTILELIYSGRCTDKEIVGFFENTFYNFQSKKQETQLVPFDLFSILKSHAQYLHDAGFIVPLGAPGNKLTDLGEVTIDFLFRTFAIYELTPFITLNKILETEKKVRMDHDIIRTISSLFEGACLSKVPREKVEEVINFYEKIGVSASDLGSPEYSSYAVFFGWMENHDLGDIEQNYKVFTSQLPQVASEIGKLLLLDEKLAYKKNIPVPKEFRDFRDRIRFGVTEEELPFVRLRGIGRETSRKIRNHCETIFRKPPLNYKGSMMDIFVEMYKRLGEAKFKEELQYIKGVGKGKKSAKILELVKSRFTK